MRKLILTLSVFLLLVIFARPVLASVIPNDPDFSLEWYLPMIKAPQAWSYGTGSSDVVVAVIDSGVDIYHPDLVNNIWRNIKEIPGDKIDNDKNGYVDDINGWDFVTNSSDPLPKISNDNYQVISVNHGTMVSGIIAAQGDNNFGIAGINWHAKIMPLRIVNTDGSGEVSNLVKAIYYAVDNGAQIINLSLIGFSNNPELKKAIDYAYNKNVLVVAAVGNNNKDPHDLNYPTIYPVCESASENKILGVGALNQSGLKSVFSNYGQNCVDVMAPGERLYSTTFYQPALYGFRDYFSDNLIGTSGATAVVSGAAALLKSLSHDLSNKDLISLIVNNADPIANPEENLKGKLGGGSLNLEKTVKAAVEYSIGKSFAFGSMVPYIIVGSGVDQSNEIKTFNNEGTFLKSWPVFDDKFQGGIITGVGDVNGDGELEVVAGPESRGSSHIKIFNRQGVLKYEWWAFDKKLDQGGVSLAVGNLDNNNGQEIVAATYDRGAMRARIFDAAGKRLQEFMLWPKGFKGRVELQIGDVNGDQKNEIVAASVSMGGAQVKIFDTQGQVLSQFFVADQKWRGIWHLSLGDTNGDGHDEIAAISKDKSWQVKFFDFKGAKIGGFSFGNPKSKEASIVLGDIDNDGRDDIILGQDRAITIYSAMGILEKYFMAWPNSYDGGFSLSYG